MYSVEPDWRSIGSCSVSVARGSLQMVGGASSWPKSMACPNPFILIQIREIP